MKFHLLTCDCFAVSSADEGSYMVCACLSRFHMDNFSSAEAWNGRWERSDYSRAESRIEIRKGEFTHGKYELEGDGWRGWITRAIVWVGAPYDDEGRCGRGGGGK